jgi:hypothetical protein
MRKNFLFLFAFTVLMSSSKAIKAEEPMIVELDEATAKSLQGGNSTKSTPTVAPTPKVSTPTVTRAAPAPKPSASKSTSSKTNSHAASTNKSKANSNVPLKPFRSNSSDSEDKAPAKLAPINGDNYYAIKARQIEEFVDRSLAQKESGNFFTRTFSSSGGSAINDSKFNKVKLPDNQNLIHYMMHEILQEPRLLDWLVFKGVDPFATNSLGQTPLSQLLSMYNPKDYPNYNLVVTKFRDLMARYKKSFTPDKMGRTELHWAAIQNKTDAMKILVNGVHPVALQAQDRVGYSATDKRGANGGYLPIDYTNKSAYSKDSNVAVPVPQAPVFSTISQDPLLQILQQGHLNQIDYYPRRITTIDTYTKPENRDEMHKILRSAGSYESKFQLQDAIRMQQIQQQQQQQQR